MKEAAIVDRLKALIVDDSKVIHLQLKDVLADIYVEGQQLDFDDAYGFEDFKKLYRPGEYALVLTDLVMEEDISGIKVINYLRHEVNDAKTRVVLMTANP